MGNLEEDVNRRLAADAHERQRRAAQAATAQEAHNAWFEGTAKPLMRDFVTLMQKYGVPAVRYEVRDPKRLGSRASQVLGWQDNRIGGAMITVDAEWVPTTGAVTWRRRTWPLPDRYEIKSQMPKREWSSPTANVEEWEKWTFEDWIRDFASALIESGEGLRRT